MRKITLISFFLLVLNTAAAISENQVPAPHESMPMGKTRAMPRMEPTKQPPVPTGPLKITFAGKTAEYTPTALAALPHVTLTVFNEHAKANQTYTGVPLIGLLTRLGVPDKPHGKDLRLYFVAEGSDGYGAVYSVAEANPDVHGGTVIVADTVDGKPITGGLQLVAAGEKRPARWVRALVAIRVMSAD